MRTLIVGGDRVDAGKTTFGVGWLAWLPIAARAFKPRAGNDYWFDHDDVIHAIERDRLYGKDIRRLLAAEGTDAAPGERNPVHRLWRPTPGETGMLGETDRAFLVDRVWTETGQRFVVNENRELPPAVTPLPTQAATEVGSLDEFDGVMESVHADALAAVHERIRSVPNAVVESYSDVAMPVQDVSFDAVALVEPSRVRLYDGERWLLACATVKDSARGRLETRTERVVTMLDPVSTIPLDPAPKRAREDPDALARLYDDAYSELWDLVN